MICRCGMSCVVMRLSKTILVLFFRKGDIEIERGFKYLGPYVVVE